jgi:DNA-binding NtrC family response regulator
MSSVPSVLVVNEISTEREEVARALEAEGFTVVQAGSATEAVREIWGGSFLVAIIATLLTGTTSTALQQQLVQLAPEIETLIHGKNDDLPALVRKVCQIRDGEAAA